jgi:hypothetical protein
MNTYLPKIVLAVVIVFCGTVRAAEVSITSDRMLEINGTRTFVLGLYESPTEEALLEEIAGAGFNLVHAPGDREALDRLHRHGLYAWINLGGLMEQDKDGGEREAQLRESVARYASHPALAVWEGPDEALWMCAVNALRSGNSTREVADMFSQNVDTLQQRLKNGYEILRQIDPAHPVWLNHAAGNSQEDLAELGRAADIVGADIYPVMPYPTQPWDISRLGLGWVGMCTDKMQRTAPGKPVWMVLQGMSWGSFENDLFTLKPQSGQWPSFEESRFMAWDAVARGARGILYWGTHIEAKDSECWKSILRTARELADNHALLTASDAPAPSVVETRIWGLLPFNASGGLGVQALGKVVDGQQVWIVANEQLFPVTYTLRGLDIPDGVNYTDAHTGTEARVHKSALTCAIPACGIHILWPQP